MPVIDDYLDKHATPPQRAELERIRQIAKRLVPDAEEVISYGIPTLKYKGKHLLYFAAFKNHMSVFPGSQLSEEIQNKLDLSKFKVAKGTIQFTEANPLPESIIKELVMNRLEIINKGKGGY